MRRVVWILAVCAACDGTIGGSGDDGDDGDGSGGDGGPVIDGPPPAATLPERLAIATVAAPAGVMAGDSNWRIWIRQSLQVAPVFTVPYADCGTLVGFTTASGTGTSAPTARVARLNPQDGLVTTHDLGPFVLRGLAAEPDGHFAALLWDETQTPAVLHVRRFDVAGAPGWRTDLIDPLAAPTDFGIGESRLEFGDGRYGAYFHVHGISGFANGHEGDMLKWLAAGTGAMSNGWSWGCSHSMSELLRYEPGSREFLAACVTDCFPGTNGTDFATAAIGGVYLEHARKVLDVDGGCNGSVAGELGGAAPGPAGWKLVWNSHQNPAALGQGSYGPNSMNQDIGFSSIATDRTPGGVVWLTSTAGMDENNATIARWSPDGDDQEQYVVGWALGSTYSLAQLSPTGAVLASPITIAAKWGERDDPMRTHGNGDIVWSWFDAAGATSFNFARIRSGRTATCAPL